MLKNREDCVKSNAVDAMVLLRDRLTLRCMADVNVVAALTNLLTKSLVLALNSLMVAILTNLDDVVKSRAVRVDTELRTKAIRLTSVVAKLDT